MMDMKSQSLTSLSRLAIGSSGLVEKRNKMFYFVC